MTKRHRVAIFGHAGVGLDIFGHRHCHKAIDNAVEHAETSVNSSRLDGSPAKFFQHRCNTRPRAEITCGPSSCSSLYFFDLEYVLFGRGVPYRGGGILQLGPYLSVVGSLSHLGQFGTNVSSYKSDSTIRVSSDPVYV